MNDLEIINKIINKRLKISIETLTVKDLLEIRELKDEEKILSEYLDMSVAQFLSLLKLNRLYQKKKIDTDTYNNLKSNLNDYYRIKNKIAEVEYISYISDNINVDNILNNYNDILIETYKNLSHYDIIFDPIDDNMASILIKGIDYNINHKKQKHNNKKRILFKNK